MINPLKFCSIALAWLGVAPVILHAQSRVGAPSSTSTMAATTSATGGGPAPAKTVGPNLLPVQSYAVIDLGGPPAPGPLGHDGTPDPDFGPTLAMDDSHNLAIAYLYDFENDFADSYAIVQTFSNGVLGPRQTYPSTIIDLSKEDVYRFDGVRPNGDLEVDHGRTYFLPPDNPLDGFGLPSILHNGSPVDFGLPPPYIVYPTFASYAGFSAKYCCYSTAYYHVTGSDGEPQNYAGEISVLSDGSQQIVFDSTLPGVAHNSDTVQYIKQQFTAVDLNDTGSGLGASLLWDRTQQKLIPTGVPTYTGFCLNDQNWFLVKDGGIWHARTEKKFTDFLQGGGYEHQLTQVQPQVLSNQNQTDGSMYVVTQTNDGGTTENVLWKGAPTAAAFQSNGLSAPLIWQPYHMQLPDGVNIKPYAFEVISTSGVIAAIGDAGTGNNHALLLVPIGLRLLNGMTTDFDGAVKKRIIPAPENPHYADDKADQNNEDMLGVKRLGLGRTQDPEAYTYDLMVAAKAPILPWIHYKWERKIIKVEWNIRKSFDGKYWYVTFRNYRLDEDDAGDDPLHSNNIPSPKLNEFYNWDDSGMHYEAGDGAGDPDHMLDPYSQKGDYVYCEKKFTYKILYRLGGGSTEDWQEGVHLYVSQTILVQEQSHTMDVTTGWKAIKNLVYEGDRDPVIDETKVRAIVKGNLPIVIDPVANPFP